MKKTPFLGLMGIHFIESIFIKVQFKNVVQTNQYSLIFYYRIHRVVCVLLIPQLYFWESCNVLTKVLLSKYVAIICLILEWEMAS